MTPELLDLAIKVSSFVLSLGAISFAWFASRRKDVDARFQKGTKRMDAHELRIAKVEQSIQAMPGKDDTHRLELQMSELAGEMKALNASMQGQNAILNRLHTIVNRHEDHLLDKGK